MTRHLDDLPPHSNHVRCAAPQRRGCPVIGLSRPLGFRFELVKRPSAINSLSAVVEEFWSTNLARVSGLLTHQQRPRTMH